MVVDVLYMVVHRLPFFDTLGTVWCGSAAYDEMKTIAI